MGFFGVKKVKQTNIIHLTAEEVRQALIAYLQKQNIKMDPYSKMESIYRRIDGKDFIEGIKIITDAS